MKPAISYFFVFLLTGILSGTVLAQNQLPVKSYNCFQTSGSIVIDGVLDDADWKNARWSGNFLDIETGAAIPSDKFTRFKMLWDSNYCYIAACLGEPHIWAALTQHDAIIYHDNDFEVFIDPDGDSKNYYELELNALGTVFDLFLNKPYNKGGKADISRGFRGLKSAVAVYGSINNPRDTDSRWTVEIAIPWSAFDENHIPENGETWRFNFSRVEWQTDTVAGKYQKKKGVPESNWVWSVQGAVNMHIPERWGKITFIKKPAKHFVPEYWVWAGGHKKRGLDWWQKELQKLSNAGITGLLLSGDSATLHDVSLLASCFGMETHVWFWTMNRGDAKPQWLSVNANGKSLSEQKAYVDYYKFMCPALPEVRMFLTDKITSLTRIKGISGIHFDYIRYVDAILPEKLQPQYNLVQKDVLPQFDYGYHPYMRKIYKKRYGIDPIQLKDPLHDTSWFNFRLKVLDTTVRMLRDSIKHAGLMVSAAVFPTPDISRKMVRQDWDQWELDYYFPMVYHNFYGKGYHWIKKVVEEDKKAAGSGSKIFCGLYVPALKKDNTLSKAIRAAMNGGADGVAFFDLDALNENTLRQIKAYTSTPKNVFTK